VHALTPSVSSCGLSQAGWEEYIGDFEAQLVKIATFTQTNAPKVEDGDYSSMGTPQVRSISNALRRTHLRTS
jgi:hypothetical protein